MAESSAPAEAASTPPPPPPIPAASSSSSAAAAGSAQPPPPPPAIPAYESSAPIAPIEADSDAGGGSDYDSIASDLTSTSSSIFDYQYENGRRYHAYRKGQYILPNDEKEQDRLDLLHHIFRLSRDGDLCLAKLNNPQRILDVGTGTGIWAIEMGDEHPQAQIVGVDLSPIQPSWVPPNVSFQIDDATMPWTYSEKFDFIHVRCMGGTITDWPSFLSHCYNHLNPGGIIELSEGRTHMECDDGTYPEDCHTRKWIAEFNRISHSHGRVFDIFPEFPKFLTDAGFQNVFVDERVCPIGTWPKDKRLKEIGKYFRYQFIEGAVDSYSLAVFTRLGSWNEAELNVLLAHVRNEVKSNKMHVYTHCSYVNAQKPLDAEG